LQKNVLKRQQLQFFIILLATLFASNLQAQDAEKRLGSWYILSTNNKLTDKLSFNLQSQVRTYEFSSQVEQFKIRASLPYQFTDKISVALGYAYFRTDPSYLNDEPQRFNEHRLVLDVVSRHAFKKIAVLHRYRAEQRIFNNETSNDNSLWLRYMLKFGYPVTDKIGVDVYNEVFLNVKSPVFAQNWLGAGVSYKINDRLTTRLGYQKINTERRSFDRILMSLNLKTDFRPTKK